MPIIQYLLSRLFNPESAEGEETSAQSIFIARLTNTWTLSGIFVFMQ